MWICWPTRHFIHLKKLKREFGDHRGQNVILEKFWGQSAVLKIFGGQNTILEMFWFQNAIFWGIFMIKTWFWETLWELKCKYARFMDQNENMRKYGSKCEHKKYEWHVNMQNIGNMMAFY